jgi:hypothetical protein
MGFFSLKAVCGACGKEVGLNRYKIKKSNAWACPECFKKAGGLGVVDVSKITIEDIKAIIKEKEEKLKGDPMNTAIGMYQYCIDNNFGSGFNESWGIKHFGVIESKLMKDEKVLMTFIGLHDYESTTKHDGNFAYAITNKRILAGQKKITGEKFKVVDHTKINDISFEAGLVFGIIKIDTPREKFKIALDKGSATSINNHIYQVLDSLKVNDNANNQQSAISAADELKKFKELLDMDIITQEEFEAKKKQLLGL